MTSAGRWPSEPSVRCGGRYRVPWRRGSGRGRRVSRVRTINLADGVARRRAAGRGPAGAKAAESLEPPFQPATYGFRSARAERVDKLGGVSAGAGRGPGVISGVAVKQRGEL